MNELQNDVSAIPLNFNPFDYGLSVGVIVVLLFVLRYSIKTGLEKFDEQAARHDNTVREIIEGHLNERSEWRSESSERATKINELCDRMIRALAKFGE
jgi:hypothetical protein